MTVEVSKGALEPPQGFRSGYVAIVGKPNVGKSTLLNALIKQKLAITTPKPQTTRHRILGVLTGPNYQILLLDTPGLLAPQYKLQEFMLRAVLSSMDDADVVLLMVDVTEEEDLDPLVAQHLERTDKPVLLVLNKIDLIQKALLLPLMDRFKTRFDFAHIVPISALLGDGLDRLLDCVVELLPPGEPYYPEDMLSEQPERFFVSELIREMIFNLFHQEVPYSTAVKVEEFTERGKKLYIKAIIFVERDSQKAIVIGKKGEALKRVGQLAREEIERFLDRPVYLGLWVKVREKWRRKEQDVRELQYRF